MSDAPSAFERVGGEPGTRALVAARAPPAVSIGIKERDQWMACMRQAMVEVGLEPALATRLGKFFFGTADWMRNRAV